MAYKDPRQLGPLDIDTKAVKNFQDHLSVMWDAICEKAPFGVWPVHNSCVCWGVDPLLHLALHNCTKWFQFCLLASDLKVLNGICQEINRLAKDLTLENFTKEVGKLRLKSSLSMIFPFSFVVGTRHGSVPLQPILARSAGRLILAGDTVKVKCKVPYKDLMWELVFPGANTVYNTMSYIANYTALKIENVLPIRLTRYGSRNTL